MQKEEPEGSGVRFKPVAVKRIGRKSRLTLSHQCGYIRTQIVRSKKSAGLSVLLCHWPSRQGIWALWQRANFHGLRECELSRVKAKTSTRKWPVTSNTITTESHPLAGEKNYQLTQTGSRWLVTELKGDLSFNRSFSGDKFAANKRQHGKAQSGKYL